MHICMNICNMYACAPALIRKKSTGALRTTPGAHGDAFLARGWNGSTWIPLDCGRFGKVTRRPYRRGQGRQGGGQGGGGPREAAALSRSRVCSFSCTNANHNNAVGSIKSAKSCRCSFFFLFRMRIRFSPHTPFLSFFLFRLFSFFFPFWQIQRRGSRHSSHLY